MSTLTRPVFEEIPAPKGAQPWMVHVPIAQQPERKYPDAGWRAAALPMYSVLAEGPIRWYRFRDHLFFSSMGADAEGDPAGVDLTCHLSGFRIARFINKDGLLTKGPLILATNWDRYLAMAHGIRLNTPPRKTETLFHLTAMQPATPF
jgi:hypothetical protein